jgi:RNA polymerase sigma factor FliA
VRPGGAYGANNGRRESEALVQQHAELVRRIAYHLAGRLPPSVEVADLIQAGMLGLLEAATSYASGKGASFETFAGIRVRGAMIDALRKLDWAPRSVHRKSREAAAALRQVEVEFGREARDTEVAARMGVPIDEYHRILQDAAVCHVGSLDEQEETFDIVDASAGPLGLAQGEEFRAALATAIGELPERERLIMSLYYDEELNLKEIGAVLKVTESRVCQLHGQALVRLKARMANWREDGGAQSARPA